MKNILKGWRIYENPFHIFFKNIWKGWRIYEKDEDCMKRMKNIWKGWRLYEKHEEYIQNILKRIKYILKD